MIFFVIVNEAQQDQCLEFAKADGRKPDPQF